MKKKCLANERCPLARGYNVIGDWWSLLIVTQISLLDLRRFGDIQQSLGLAKNILTARLKKLVDEGILNRVPSANGGAFHEYVVTEKGRDLYKVIVALRQWGEKHFCEGQPTSNYIADRAKKQPIPPIEVRSSDGRVLGAEDLVIEPRGAKGQV